MVKTRCIVGKDVYSRGKLVYPKSVNQNRWEGGLEGKGASLHKPRSIPVVAGPHLQSQHSYGRMEVGVRGGVGVGDSPRGS